MRRSTGCRSGASEGGLRLYSVLPAVREPTIFQTTAGHTGLLAVASCGHTVVLHYVGDLTQGKGLTM